MNPVLSDLITLSNRLGEPARDLTIIGEGNTSACLGDDTFYVKASGSELRTASAANFVRLRESRVLDMLNGPTPSDDDVSAWLASAAVEPGPRASTEALMHAVCLRIPGVRFVGHTHPVAVNALTCSANFDLLAKGRLFPDQVVLCGPKPLLIPYADPGVPLARVIAEGLERFQLAHHTYPREIYLRNHGLIVLGATAREVEQTTAMAVKAARILLGTLPAGGPSFMTEADVQRIHTRADEAYRRAAFERHAAESH